MVCFSLSK